MKNRIREIREEKGLTQEQLAKKSGVSRPFLSNIENGSAIPTMKTAIKISESLHKTLDELFYDMKEDK